ncbi:flagella basal body P-ring formation protein FlgA [Novosphingobium sp. KCTC 2891]|uniref:flagella basal body P-ring formation protein FlgA n=1 Tax=Novosphingobium sp. KCTC 2891 TaxID=2989730 RepID=UPI0022222D52|nr:flagella basal body P-ring formation protein FlgA [Novosphingobium sp. KCTC 2891]MCW1382987.1 flagella basal body P-ring formation protein FlgA [Novosphingobium sp. KCTC 2891]
MTSLCTSILRRPIVRRPIARGTTHAAVLASIALLAVPAHAAGFADLSAVDTAVAQFTGLPIGVPGGAQLPVDRRLRLASCAAPFALSWRGAGRDTVVVQCPDAGGWRLFVPVVTDARQDAAGPAVVRGEGVTIQAAGEGFSVSQPGEAMESGAVGAWIRVRTSAKADPVRARVVRPGLVELPVD